MVKRRQRFNRAKLFSYLPNEIFVEIFSYLNGIDAVFTFASLNHRFRCLVSEYCQSFDFQSISKSQFNLVSQLHNNKQWKSLTISDDKHTLDFVEYFTQVYSLINDFPQLQSLTIRNLNSNQNYPILSQLSSLRNLVSLRIEPFCSEKISPFDLPNLKRLIFTSCENLDWIQNFCQVESIEYTMDHCFSHLKDLIWPSTLKYLKIICVSGRRYDSILRSLDRVSSLISLEFYQRGSSFTIPDGQVWENLIRSSLPLLEIFKFRFKFQSYQISDAQIKSAIASFSMPFYVHERKWFIQSDICSCFVIIYSIPFAFDRYRTFRCLMNETISTSLENDLNNKYEHVKTLTISHTNAEPDDNFNKTQVINLIVYVDFNFLHWLHVFTKLRHLEVASWVKISSKDFRRLLNTTSHLCSLNIKTTLLRTLTEDWNNTWICNYLSEKISSLKLHQLNYRLRPVSENELRQIIRIFGSACQHLSLTIQSPHDTIPLILQNMFQLHSLHVYVVEKNCQSLNMSWLEKQKTKFNQSNCKMVDKKPDYYFWL